MKPEKFRNEIARHGSTNGTPRSGDNTGFQYNNDGLLQFAAYPEGNSVTYNYDSSNSQARSKGNLLSIVENPGPRGTGDPAESTRSTTFTYENFNNQVTSVTNPNGLTVTKHQCR